MEYLSKKKFPVNSRDYKLYEEVGEGVSATVYRALCIPFNEIVAVKVLDLERRNSDLDGIQREVKTMCLIDHPNLLRAHCSFSVESYLWVVMPYMACGSCLHIMKSSYPEGFEQGVIATVLREVLKALVYLHSDGHIHRDVKAGNILVDSKGAIKLADFGVSACMFDAGDRQRSRNTFVGTPCWMAPEVMQQSQGYDFKADIWSFGITALELAHGHAPFSKYPPMKVLLMTLQNAPPGLDYERDRRFSKSFKEMVAACLVKDPNKRPTSQKLLKHSFFKHAHSKDFMARTVLNSLAPLGDRFRMLKAKEAELLVQNRGVDGNKEQLSQWEYIQGISAWNFDLEDLKNQAALIEDDHSVSKPEDLDLSIKNDGLDTSTFSEELLSVESNTSNTALALGGFDLNNMDAVESPPISFPLHSPGKQEVQSYICLDDGEGCDSNHVDVGYTIHEEKKVEASPRLDSKQPRVFPGNDLAASREVNGDDDRAYYSRESSYHSYPSDWKCSDQLLHHQRGYLDGLPSVEDALREQIFQYKGRFKVSVTDFSLKDSENGQINCFLGASLTSITSIASSVIPMLQCILQQNTMQKEQIIRLIKYVNQTTGDDTEFAAAACTNEEIKMSIASAKERDLLSQVIQSQQRTGRLIEELLTERMRNAQLERRLTGLLNN